MNLETIITITLSEISLIVFALRGCNNKVQKVDFIMIYLLMIGIFLLLVLSPSKKYADLLYAFLTTIPIGLWYITYKYTAIEIFSNKYIYFNIIYGKVMRLICSVIALLLCARILLTTDSLYLIKKHFWRDLTIDIFFWSPFFVFLLLIVKDFFKKGVKHGSFLKYLSTTKPKIKS